MCTVIYLPTEAGPQFSSCRDEDPGRAATSIPRIVMGNTGALLYPEDGVAKGTWLGAHENGTLLILLNGAKKTHIKQPFYVKSRGLIVKQLLDCQDPLSAWDSIGLAGIEPFTLVIWYYAELYELTWDEKKKHLVKQPLNQPKIWSSVTLYNEKARAKRKDRFDKALSQQKLTSATDLYNFLSDFTDPDIGFIMRRHSQIQTVSISLISVQPQAFLFRYSDLLTNQTTEHSFLPAQVSAI